MPRLVPPIPRGSGPAGGSRPPESAGSVGARDAREGGAGSEPPQPLAAGDARGAEVALRLAIGREGIGLELARPARVGCLTVTELAAALPGMRFPVDVSGGVPRFRNRRGELRRIEVELGARALERWLAPRLRGVVGARTPEVWVGVRRDAATVCVSATREPDEEPARAAPVLAFEVQALADGGDVVLVVERARGSELPAAATALAIACVEAALAGAGERAGAAFVLRDAAGAIARALFPEAGARVPAAGGVRWASFAAQGDTWVVHALDGAAPAAPSEQAVRAREVSLLVREGDDALVRGDVPGARAAYLDALERAPRHPEIARRIVDIDAREGGRAEAALAMLAEVRDEARLGTTPGELLAETHDAEAAMASLERAGQTETAPALAARAFELAARLARDAEEAARWLDRAVARSPRSTTARWMRVARRLELGRLEDAMADLEHIEALARGGRAKHAVWLRAGRAWQKAGLGAKAGAIFERALRYVPDEPRALAGLGAAMLEEGGAPGSTGGPGGARERRDGRQARGAAVLARALEIAEARGEVGARIRVDLARALAERLGDLPTAIAHVSMVPAEAAEAPIARGLEGRWRAALGDVAGAALAFARLRELASSPAIDAGAIAALLLEAAELARARMNDPLAAQRHLAAALRIRPRDEALLRAYREVGPLVAHAGDPDEDFEPAAAPEARDAPVAGRAPAVPFPAGEASSSTHRPALADAPLPPLDLALPSDPPDAAADDPPEDDAVAAARVEELTRRLHGDPGNDAVADELATLLAALGRGHELLGLLMGRLEDATPERRAELAPRARAALEHLAADAEAAGRREEAALFRSAIASSCFPHP